MTAILRLHAVGDILLYGRYDGIAAQGAEDTVFATVRPLLAEADLVVGNLECPLTERGSPRGDKLCLRGSPRYAKALRAAGFEVLSLANNHAFDFGPEGWADTAAQLRRAGIYTLGAGADLAAARRPLIVERRGLRLGFLAYCHPDTNGYALAGPGTAGVAPLRREYLLEDIEQLRPKVHHVVLLLHWGLEYSPHPTPDQVALARAAVERGAGLVLGAHSHQLQGIERYQGGWIAYSLANFTDADVEFQGAGKTYCYRMRDVDRESVLLKVDFTEAEIRLVDAVPLWLADDGRPGPAEPSRAERIRGELATLGAALAQPDLARRWEQQLVERRVLAPLVHWWRSGSLWDKLRRFNLGQVKTLYLLVETFVRIKFSRGESRWSLFSPRNDRRPMPYAGPERDHHDG